MNAADTMYRHRYGETGPATAVTTGQLSEAANELNQWLRASQIPFEGQALTGPSVAPAYVFRFKLPLDHVVQQLGPGVLTIAARHSAPVTLLSVHRAGPEAVIVLGAVDTAKRFFSH